MNEEGLEALLGTICECEGEAVFCQGKYTCEQCCYAISAIINIQTNDDFERHKKIVDNINKMAQGNNRGYVVGKGGVAR